LSRAQVKDFLGMAISFLPLTRDLTAQERWQLWTDEIPKDPDDKGLGKRSKVESHDDEDELSSEQSDDSEEDDDNLFLEDQRHIR